MLCIIVVMLYTYRSLRSSIRSGASNIVTGIVNLTRAGSMRMRNSIRRQGSIRRQEDINEARATTSINRGRSVSSSEQQLLAEPPSSGLDHLVDDSAGAAQSMNDNTVRTAPPPQPSLSSLCNGRAQNNTKLFGHHSNLSKTIETGASMLAYKNGRLLCKNYFDLW